jgi:hypothetical protein
MRLLATALGALLISAIQPALSQDALAQAQLQQEELQLDEPQQVEPQQGELRQEELRQEEARKEALRQEELRQEEARQEALRQEALRREALRQEELRQEQLRQEHLQQEHLQQEQLQRAALEQQEPQQGEPQAEELQPGKLPRDAKWTVFVEPELGTRIDVPSAVFSVDDGPALKGVGQQFKTPDGRAVLAVYSQRNKGQDAPASYRKKNFKGSRAVIDYDRVTRDFFALSGNSEDTIYYSRCNFSREAGGTIHCFDLKYARREKLAWDGIVTRMSRSLKAP